MSGRNFFKRHRRAISLCCWLTSYLPSSVCYCMLSVLFNMGSRIAIFGRYILLNNLANLGEACYFSRSIVLKNMHNFSCGDNFSCHEFSFIDAIGGITIGNNVSIAHNSSLITFNHGYDDTSKPIKYNDLSYGKITIGNDVWIGSGVRVLPNVKIGDRCIVAAGAVVNSDIPSDSIFAGVPAKLIKRI